MATFEIGDIVRAPFPYTDRDARRARPALVVSRRGLGPGGSLVWVVMITSAENRRWPGDVGIRDHRAVGLPAPSVIRPSKIATVEAGRLKALGELDTPTLGAVKAEIDRILERCTPPR